MSQKPPKNLLKSEKAEKNKAKSGLLPLSTDPNAKKTIPEIDFRTQKTALKPSAYSQIISKSLNQNRNSRSRYNSIISTKKRIRFIHREI